MRGDFSKLKQDRDEVTQRETNHFHQETPPKHLKQPHSTVHRNTCTSPNSGVLNVTQHHCSGTRQGERLVAVREELPANARVLFHILLQQSPK